MNRIALVFSLMLLGVLIIACQTPKKEAENRINQWYAEHPQGYNLHVTGKAEISRYHPERPEEKDDLIVVNWKGMQITLTFRKPISELVLTKESLQDNLSFYVLDDIYSDIDLNGWKVYPRVPVSSSSTGLNFTKVEGKQIVFSIDWESYTVFGYAQNEFCQEQLEIMDSSMPEKCYISVEKRLPLHLDVDVRLP